MGTNCASLLADLFIYFDIDRRYLRNHFEVIFFRSGIKDILENKE